jgi:hypothetical protein
MKTLKVFINTFRQLTFKKFIRLLKLSLSNPIFSILSFVATVRAYLIAKKYFREPTVQMVKEMPSDMLLVLSDSDVLL